MRYSWKAGAVLMTFVLLLVFTGCSSDTAQPSAKIVAMGDASVRETILVANPEGAVADIYSSLAKWDEQRIKEAKLSARELEEVVGIEASAIEEYYAFRSNAKKGLADVMLIKPAAGANREDIRTQLWIYRDRRISEFENYDILNSFEIAQNATVYDQGDYIILLMLSDNEAGQDIIDQYIPQ